MANLYVDIYFRGMTKMILEEYDLSFFRGINRVAHEYARRLPEQTEFENTFLFGSRLPSITQRSFEVAGIHGYLHGPASTGLRERLISMINHWDRRLSKGPVSLRKFTRIACAAARAASVKGMNRDLYVPRSPEPEDVWISICSPFTAPIRRLKSKRVLVCYDFNQVYHYRELGLAAADIEPLNPGIDVQPDEWVICISEYTRLCFFKFHPGFPRDRVFVVPLGANISTHSTPTNAAAVLKKNGIESGEYFLTLAAGGPHKNSGYIISEFLDWSEKSDVGNATKLVLVGSGQNQLIPQLPEKARLAIQQGKILFTGYAPDEDLPALYENCSAFLFASLAEGFGLPPLEAMMYGAPVVCSDKTSLPEVVGDAGLSFDPLEKGALSRCLETISSNPALRESLRQRGLRRAADFSWDKSARTFADVLKQIAITA